MPKLNYNRPYNRRVTSLIRAERDGLAALTAEARKAFNKDCLEMVRAVLASEFYVRAPEDDFYVLTLEWLEEGDLRYLGPRVRDNTASVLAMLRGGYSVQGRRWRGLAPSQSELSDWMVDRSLLPKKPPGRR